MSANRQKEHQSFASFWPFYLQEHAKPVTHNLHHVGTSLMVLIALYSVLTENWLLLLAMPIASTQLPISRATCSGVSSMGRCPASS